MTARPVFLLDVDGVLANWVQGVIDLFGLQIDHNDWTEWDHYKHFGITDSELFEKAGPEFWLGLRPYSWASDLLYRLRLRGDVVFATSPFIDPDCAAAKIRWLRNRGFMGRSVNDYMIGPYKYLMGGNGILIDDSQDNVDKFRDIGKGNAILFPQAWNVNRKFRGDAIPYVMNLVDLMTDKGG